MWWQKSYDVVIAGSGLGAASLAYKLSSAGLKILILERGDWPKRDDEDWKAESILIKSRYAQKSATFIRQYESPSSAAVHMNENVGGMSVFYGGAAFRMRESDFGSWPYRYAELAPFYDQAEELLEVHGARGEDPLEPPSKQSYPFPSLQLNPPAQRIYDAASKLGMRPFRTPLAINFKNKTRSLCIQCETCDGYPCRLNAKNEATTILAKAQASGNLDIATGVLVDKVHSHADSVRSIDCVSQKDGTRHSIKSKLFVISAGTIGSAGILLRSQLDSRFPHARLIGKNLMRHANGIVSAIFPFKTNPRREFHKQVCVSHFYEETRSSDGFATGIIQDIYTPQSKVIRHFGPKGLSFVGAALSPFIQNLLCIAEDEPQEKNRVFLSSKTDEHGVSLLEIEHSYTQRDEIRRDFLMSQAKRILRKAGGIPCNQMLINTFSHALGTARFGISDRSAVLNSQCQFFGLKNLYVVDGSFMPTSAGVNPSLTIVANALKVAEHLSKSRESWS